MKLEITDKAVYRTIHWTVESGDDTYYVQCQEDDICDTWFVTSDEEGSINRDSDLGRELIEFCSIDLMEESKS